MSATRIELVTSRDPNSASGFRVFVNGVEIGRGQGSQAVEVSLYSVDPGAGCDASDWFENFDDDYRAASSDAVRRAVEIAYAEGYASPHISHKPEHEDTARIVADLTRAVAARVPDAVRAVLRRMDSPVTHDPHHWLFRVGFVLADVELTGGRLLSATDPETFETLHDALLGGAPVYTAEIPWDHPAVPSTDADGFARITITEETAS